MPQPSATKERSYDGDYMAAGKLAEEVCLEFVKRNPKTVGVEDTRNLRVLQEADVDCIVHLMDGQLFLAEIKSDRHLGVSGNVLFELLRINHTCREDRALVLGWTFRSPAKWLLYYSPTRKSIYMARFADLRAVFQRYSREVRKGLRLDIVPTDSLKSTVNALVPWERCQAAFKVYDVTDLAEEFEQRQPAIRTGFENETLAPV